MLLISCCIRKQYVFILMVSVTDMGHLLVYGPAELADRPTVYVRWQGAGYLFCFVMFCPPIYYCDCCTSNLLVALHLKISPAIN